MIQSLKEVDIFPSRNSEYYSGAAASSDASRPRPRYHKNMDESKEDVTERTPEHEVMHTLCIKI